MSKANIKSKLRKSAEVVYTTLELEHTFDGDKSPTVLKFRIRPVSLGDILKSAVGFPALYALIEGVTGNETAADEDDFSKAKKTAELLDAFEALVCLSVELDVDGEWTGFSLEDSGDNLTPGMLPAQLIAQLGQAVVTNFRLSIR